MGAALELERGERALAFDGGDRVRESARVTGLRLDDLEPPAAPRCERPVHVEQFAGPERGLVAADAHADLEDEARDARLLAGDERLDDVAREVAGAGLERGALGLRHGGHLRVAGGDEFGESCELARGAAELRERLERAREQGAAAREFHRLAVVCGDGDVLELRGDAVVLRLLGEEDPAEVLRQEFLLDRGGACFECGQGSLGGGGGQAAGRAVFLAIVSRSSRRRPSSEASR